MERRRRWLASLLALVLAVGLLPTAAWASGEVDNSVEDTEQITETEVETGSTAAEFLSDNTAVDSTGNVTRAQLAEMICNNAILGGNVNVMRNPTITVAFNDINACTPQQREAITALCQAQIITGTSATTFSPDEEVNLGEALVVIWRAAGSRANSTAWEASEYYIDADKFEDWYAPAVNCFYGAGLIKGEKIEEGGKPEFRGDQPVTRERAQGLINKFQSDSEDYIKFLQNTKEGAVTRATMLVEFYDRFAPELSAVQPTSSGREAYAAFTDISGCTSEQLQAIQFFTEREIVRGTVPGSFSPFVPVPNFQVALLTMSCATKSPSSASENVVTEDGDTMSQSVVSMALDQGILSHLTDFFGKDSPVIEVVSKTPDAPALTNDLVSWSESLRPVEPTADNSNTTITSGQPLSVSLSCATEGAIIYYTVDSSDPATSETRQTYSATHVITISQPTILRAVAVNNNLVSDELKLQYTYPALSLSASPTSLTGGGKVTLTVGGTAEETQVSVTCTSHTGVAIGGSGNVYTVDLPNADGTYTFIASAAGYTTASCTVTVRRYSSGSSSSSSNTTTSTERNPDGSTTTTTTNKTTGTVTETTRYPDGSREVVETKRDGTVTTTSTDADGNQTRVVESPDGSMETAVDNADGTASVTTEDPDGRVTVEAVLPASAVNNAGGEAVVLPMPAVRAERDRDDAPTVTVDLPRGASVLVEIPVGNAAVSTVALLVHADGTEEIVKTSLATEDGVAVSLSDGDTVKIVDNGKTFYDVPGSHWGAEAIDFVTSRELFGGTSAVTFEPERSMNRGMLVTVLYRLENEPNVWGGGSYTDVPEGMYYSSAVAWADGNGIVTGYADAAFAPGRDITREEMAVVLYRYARYKGLDVAASTDLGRYTDAGSISVYAQQAMAWANAHGLITADTTGALTPRGYATRAQVAAILQRFLYLMDG